MAEIEEVVDWAIATPDNIAHHPTGPRGRDSAVTSFSFREMQAALARWRDKIDGDIASGGGGSPGGSDTQLQYNDGGSLGGIPHITYNDITSQVVFNNTGGANEADKFFFSDGLQLANLKTVQFGDSSNYITGSSGDYVEIFTGNSRATRWGSTLITLDLPITLTAADRLYFDGGGNTHIRESSADVLDITVGNRLVLQLDDTSTAGDTNMLLYDVDNATTERVTVGAADSGGSGYKVLRIPN